MLYFIFSFYLSKSTIYIHQTVSQSGTKQVYNCKFFDHTRDLIVEAIECERLPLKKLETATTKSLYISFTETMPPPAIELTHVDREWDLVWRRLHSGVLTSTSRDTLYLIIHDRLYTRERGHRLMPGRVDDNLCQRCYLGSETISHKFQFCQHSFECWETIRELIDTAQPLCTSESDHSLLNLYFSAFHNDNTIV